MSLDFLQEACMSLDHDDSGEALVAFISGALIGAAATVLFLRMRHNRALASAARDEDYYYDGGDLFV